jgi:RHS repeat-associated protein
LTPATGPWGTGSFKYDPLGNLREKKLGNRTVTNSYNNTSMRLTSWSDTSGPLRSASYDARGNITQLGDITFTYDMADQPVAQGVGVPATFVYDGNYKRVRQTMDGETIYSVYNAAGAMVHRDNVTTGKKTDYVSAAGQSIVRVENGTPTWIASDHLGSASKALNTSGFVTWEERYTPFGEGVFKPTGNKNQTGFTGHIQDDASGLTYMQARFYDPVIGRFLSIDPVGFVASGNDPRHFNRYGYGFNDPVNKVDPDGRAPQSVMDQRYVAPVVGPEHAANIQQVHNDIGNALGEGMYDFFIADAVNTATSAMEGDLKGVAVGAVLTVSKPAKALDKAKDVAKMAKDLSKKINKNSVTIKTPDGAKRFDLQGASHKGVETPHVQGLKNNTNPETGETFLNKVSSDVQPMTKSDIRTVEKYIEKLKDQ